eukprot:11335079-Alexandrium_andersonii.AAC.1
MHRSHARASMLACPARALLFSGHFQRKVPVCFLPLASGTGISGRKHTGVSCTARGLMTATFSLRLSSVGKGDCSLRSQYTRARHSLRALPLRSLLDPVLRFGRIWSLGSRGLAS